MEVALSMCIVLLISLLPIDHVTTWTPSEHTDWPARIGWCAHAGIAVATTTAVAIAVKAAAPTPLRRAAPLGRLRASAFTVPPRTMSGVR